MAKLINGKELSAEIRAEVAAEAVEFRRVHRRAPGLAVILVGSDPASRIYVRNKDKACRQCGIYSEVIELPEETPQEELLAKIEELNNDRRIDGILVQLPLPDHMDQQAVIRAITPEKDVDVFHPENVGKLTTGCPGLRPCTPSGILEMLKRTGIGIRGKDCTVVGRSNIVGRPMALMLLHEDGTVTVCHSKTKDLKSKCLNADILVVAVGRPKLITADMVKEGAVVIDVGINRLEDGTLCGDVDFENVGKIASYISPVPGGVGPMTIAMLMKNTLTAAQNRMKKDRE